MNVQDLLGPAGVKPEGRPWFSVTAQGDETGGGKGSATVRIYDVIGGWFGTNAADLVAELDALDVDQIDVHVNSPGGAVWDGTAIFNALRQHDARIVVTVDGLAASAASVIAMAGDEIVMAEGSQMMIHRASGGVFGSAELMRETAAVLDKIDQNIAGIYSRRAGGDAAGWLAAMDAETWYNADEAVDAGLADRTDHDMPANVEAVAQFDLSMFNYRGRQDAPAPSMLGVLAQGFPVSAESGKVKEEEKLMKEFLIALQERLGVDAEASVEEILAALDEALAERAEPSVPEGVVMVDATKYAELEAQAQAGVEAQAKSDAERREGIVSKAVEEGRIAPANRDMWVDMLAKDEPGTVALIGSLTPNAAVPVVPIGNAEDAEQDADAKIYNRVGWGSDAEGK